MSNLQIAVLSQNTGLKKAWSAKLESAGIKVKEASNDLAALCLLESLECCAIVISESSGSGNPIELIRTIARNRETVPIVFVATNSSEELAIRSFRAGAADYVRDPLDLDDILASVTRVATRLPREQGAVLLEAGLDPVTEDAATRILIGESAAIHQVKLRLLRAAAAADSSVLITGETGTGKELAAQVIHNASARKKKSLVSVNCAAIPESLLESELFGYEKGAFTGAQWANAGVLERADGGTLFLDEVGELSLAAQAKILRVIESKEFSRLGSREVLRVNMRFVAATNQNLEELAKQGKFRWDLIFRLNVVRIHLPALRERKEDLPALISHYLHGLNVQFGRQVRGISRQSNDRLLAYDWPGNVRELKNLLEACFVEADPTSDLLDLPTQCNLALDTSRLPEERDRLLKALLATEWNKSEAARQLRWSRMTLYRKMAKFQLHRRVPDTGTHVA